MDVLIKKGQISHEDCDIFIHEDVLFSHTKRPFYSTFIHHSSSLHVYDIFLSVMEMGPFKMRFCFCAEFLAVKSIVFVVQNVDIRPKCVNVISGI